MFLKSSSLVSSDHRFSLTSASDIRLRVMGSWNGKALRKSAPFRSGRRTSAERAHASARTSSPFSPCATAAIRSISGCARGARAARSAHRTASSGWSSAMCENERTPSMP